jgi:hypothetical protein
MADLAEIYYVLPERCALCYFRVLGGKSGVISGSRKRRLLKANEHLNI